MASLDGYVEELSPKQGVEYRMKINGTLYDGKISGMEKDASGELVYSFSGLRAANQSDMSKEYEDFTMENTPASKVKVYKKEDSGIYSDLGGKRRKRTKKQIRRKRLRSKSRKLNRKTK
jgi:hypothetical protein